MSKVDPGLLHVVAHELRRPAGTPEVVHVAVKFTGDIDDLRAGGFEPLGTVRQALDGASIAAGRIPIDALGALEAVDHVVDIEGSQQMRPVLHHSVPAIRADVVHAPPYSLTGEGVVIGIVDIGFDWRHPAFTRADGTSRVIGLWDQSLTPDPALGERAPDAFPGLGVEYTKRQIQDALEGNGTVRTTDAVPQGESHGTYVAGIAAGDGSEVGLRSESSIHVGVAPAAELIVVVGQNLEQIGQEPGYMHAFDFIWNHPLAAGRPVVVNVSMGDLIGPRDGSTLMEQAITADLWGSRGRAVVAGAGNERDTGRHTHVTGLLAAEDDLVAVNVPAGTRRLFVELWYPTTGEVRFSVTAPNGDTSEEVDPDDSGEMSLDGGDAVVTLTSGTRPNGRWIYVSATLVDPDFWDALPDGRWYVNVTNVGQSPVDIHAWCDSVRRRTASPVSFGFALPSRTVTAPGTCDAVITVGAYAPSGQPNHDATGDLAPFSSFGPTRDGREKPDLVAPGVGITGPWSDTGIRCWGLCWEQYRTQRGTSAAAPHVAGVVALMFQRNPDLTHTQVKQLLREAANPQGRTDDDRRNSWGAGSVDAAVTIDLVPPRGWEDPPVPGPPPPEPDPDPGPG